MEYILFIVVAIFITTGFVGSFLPLLPGVPLIFVGTLLLYVFSDNPIVSLTTVIIFGILALISILIDYLSGVFGAKLAGAARGSVLAAFGGSLLGALVLGLPGILFGPAIGVILFELYSNRRFSKQTIRLAKTTLISTVAGIIVNGLIAITMVVVLLVALFV